jgi:hypothetical protein
MYLISGGISPSQPENFCESPGYNTTMEIYSTSSTINSLLNATIYTDNTLSTPLNGGFLYYAVSTTNINTFDVGPSGYSVLEVDTSGYVSNLLSSICTSGGGGDGEPIIA